MRTGETLVRIVAIGGGADPATLELEAARARAEMQLAERDLARQRELLALRAVAAKQVDIARAARESAAARLTAAQRQLAALRGDVSGAGPSSASTVDLRSPIDGVVSFADVTPGAVVEAGKRLVSIIEPARLWLDVRVYEHDAGKVERSSGAEFTVGGIDRRFTVDESNGRRVAVGAVVDPSTRTVPIVFELANPGELKPGMFVQATVRTGEISRALAIPESAVVDSDGVSTVFVLKGGETFAKRRVRLGVRSDGFVQVLEGVREGERVVSRGAYEIQLATASGAIPELGHQH